MALKHSLSWSTSRASGFKTCKRRYYLDYYQSWKGWVPIEGSPRRQAYLLKKMTRMPMYTGSCVHDAIESWLKAHREGQAMDRETLIQTAVNALREGYRDSRDAMRKGRWDGIDKRSVRLAEHRYKEPSIDEPSGAAGDYGRRHLEIIETSLKTFFEHPALERVRNVDPEDILGIEEMGTIDLLGTPVYAIPDFAMVSQDGPLPHAWIYDWKTGSERERDADQLAAYVLYAGETWGVAPEDVTCVAAYLAKGEVREHRFTSEEVEAMAARIATSIQEMEALHFDADEELGDPERFPKVADDEAGMRICGRCNYRAICDREVAG
jgi:hypothetical protein